MKKIFLTLLILVFVLGCIGKNRGITYSAAKEKPLSTNEVRLEIVDKRENKEILSPSVKKIKLWSGVGGFVNLIDRAKKKKPHEITGEEVKNDFIEAFTARFTNLGIKVVSRPPAGGLTLTIEIEKISLDLVKSKFKADVTYMARAVRNGKPYHQERISGLTERYNTFGQRSGQKALSEAFSLAVNRLDTDFLK